MNRIPHAVSAMAVATTLGLVATGAFAQATIDHSKALAGSVTPGDTAGYPITITRAGHYKLMSNLAVPAGQPAIVITAPRVTLDLNGFAVAGPVTCSSAGYSVSCDTPAVANLAGITVKSAGVDASVVIRNGSVSGFAGHGILVERPENVLIEDVLVSRNAGVGINMGLGAVDGNIGYHGTVRGVGVHLNMGGGIVMSGGIVERSRVHLNKGAGILGIGPRTLVSETLAANNTGLGFSNVALRGSVVQSNPGAVGAANVVSLGGNHNGLSPF